ncbi:hypothetical protein [Desulfofalx alkaliphila]|uniref:hypothetical protein n=1 Tax=Desulfofalx alkaliphila TaxID=105483 RepID=UPI0004E0BA42|nr:hypothetical protein [Desulfofalx alkaliphila]
MSSTTRKAGKYTDFTPDEIKEYLTRFRKAILDGKYTIAKGRKRRENMEFIEDYRINTKKEREILLGIQYDDFCYAVDNQKEEFAHEKLYIFCKSQELDYWGELETVDIYIKINMTQTKSGDDYTVVVSFHRRNKPIKYLFK